MNILVLGCNGMLGSAVTNAVKDAGHSPIPSGVSTRDLFELRRVDDDHTDIRAVINCAGVIPSKHRSEVLTIGTNSIGPRLVAKVFSKSHVVNMSTDCVFSGRRKAAYSISDRPDPEDLYGRSKLLGEVTAPHVTNIRTSFVGLDHGLVPWFLGHVATEEDHPGKVPGWTNAWWSGSTVYEVAKRLVEIAETEPRGIVHLATEHPITKYDLLVELQRVFKRGDLVVEKVSDIRARYRNLAFTYYLAPFNTVAHQLASHAGLRRIRTVGSVA